MTAAAPPQGAQGAQGAQGVHAVVAAGLGAVSAAGHGPRALAAAVGRDHARTASPVPPEFAWAGGRAAVTAPAVDLPAEPPGGPPVPPRLARYLTREGSLFLHAATAALGASGTDVSADPHGLAVVCATEAAGAREYAATHRSGRTGTDSGAVPVRGPQSSFNSPASHLSIHLGIQGPCITLATDGAGGLVALRHAQTLLRAGRAAAVLVGGVDTYGPRAWAGGRCHGEAAGAVVLRPAGGTTGRPGGARVGPVVSRADPAAGSEPVAAAARAAMDAAGVTPELVDLVVTASVRPERLGACRAALADVLGAEVVAVDRATGAVPGAAGVLAVVLAAHLVTRRADEPANEPTDEPTEKPADGRVVRHVLCLATGDTGSTHAVVVSEGGARR